MYDYYDVHIMTGMCKLVFNYLNQAYQKRIDSTVDRLAGIQIGNFKPQTIDC